jgi:hypothetical protein
MANESSTERKALQTSHLCCGMQDSLVKTRDRALLEISFWRDIKGESRLPPFVRTLAYLGVVYETFTILLVT